MDWEKEVVKVAKAARLELSEKERARYARQMEGVMMAFDELAKLDVDVKEAKAEKRIEKGALRKDEAKKTDWDPFCCVREKRGKLFVGPGLVDDG